jgi:hypothetical protein
VANQRALYDRFDAVVLLSAPVNLPGRAITTSVGLRAEFE